MPEFDGLWGPEPMWAEIIVSLWVSLFRQRAEASEGGGRGGSGVQLVPGERVSDYSKRASSLIDPKSRRGQGAAGLGSDRGSWVGLLPSSPLPSHQGVVRSWQLSGSYPLPRRVVEKLCQDVLCLNDFWPHPHSGSGTSRVRAQMCCSLRRGSASSVLCEISQKVSIMSHLKRQR